MYFTNCFYNKNQRIEIESFSGCFTYGLDNDRSSGRIFNLHDRRYVLYYKGNCCPLQWWIYRTDFGVLWRHFISVQIRTPPFEKSSRGSEIVEKRIQIPDYAHLLPKEIASFTTNTVYNNENTHLSFTQGGGHGGSHPHLVHEFIRSILEERKPAIDDIMGAYWTGTGICAHESAMKNGEVITIPRFE